MIYRVRKFKTRYGFNEGRCYTGIHFGKRSWYFPHHERGGFFFITDKKGRTNVRRAV